MESFCFLVPTWFPPEHQPKPIKFSRNPDLNDEDCVYLLSKYMDKNPKQNKLMQKLFIK